MKKYKNLVFLFLLVTLHVSAQQKLSLQQAIEIGLQNNYSIRIANVSADIARVNDNYGNAGYLPSVALQAAGSESSYNTRQEFSTGVNVRRNNALTNNINAAVALNWTVFDGMKMFATKDKLEMFRVQGEVSVKIEIENTISKIIGAYYDAVRQQQLIKAGNEALKVYSEREKIAQKKLDIGSGSKLDLLQARLDLNAQRSALMKQEMASQTAIIALNQLLSKSADETYTVDDSISVNDALIFSNIKTAALKDNNQIHLAQNNIVIANDLLKEAKSTRLPQIGINANYNLLQTKNQVGLILLNQNKGLNAGVSASLNVFNGYKSRTQVRVAGYMMEQNKIQLSQTISAIDVSLLKSWKDYQNTLQILKLEEENILLAKENVEVALERFRIGSSGTIELMLAQRSFEDANSRLVSARYDAKLAETELLRLEGQLVK